MNNTFYSFGYSLCTIHTWYTSQGVFKVQSQIGKELKEHKTIIGAKRWINKRLAQIEKNNNATIEYYKRIKGNKEL